MAELLNLQGKCQPLRTKPAHFVSHLPLASVLDSLYRRVVKDPENYGFLREAYLKGYNHTRTLPTGFEDHLRMTKAMRDIVTLKFILSSKNASVQTWGRQRANQIFVQLEAYLERSPTLGI